jgi:chromosome segregation ATPase
MAAERRRETNARHLTESDGGLDLDTSEFLAACLAISKPGEPRDPSAPAPAPAIAHDPTVEMELRRDLDSLREELTAARLRHNETIAALNSATQLADHDRSKLAAAMRAISDRDTTIEHLRRSVSERDQETIAALQSASQLADHDRTELAAAMNTIAERDSAIEQLSQSIAERDREIAELQRLALQAEEDRIADAAAILGSLDEYRA